MDESVQQEGSRERASQAGDRIAESCRLLRTSLEELSAEVRQLAQKLVRVNNSMDSLREEFAWQFSETRRTILSPYSEPEHRIPPEVQKESEDRDPLDLIRERFGKKP